MKVPSCKICKKPLFKSTAKVCSVACALEYNTRYPEKIKTFMQKLQRQETKEAKKKLKTHKDWLKDLEYVFNKYIRMRDHDKPCISCGTEDKRVIYHAGHYYAAGNYSYLRFDEYNVNKQCGNYCNKMKRGNFPEYTVGLTRRYGKEVVERLERERHLKVKLSIPEIQEKIEYYKQKIKELKNAA